MSGVGPELLGRLLDEHAAALTLYARQWCRAPEDVVQEAFLKLVAQAAPPHHPVAWLYRVVRNAAISAQRAARRRHHYEAAASRTCPWFTASHDTRLDVETATAALQTLPGEQREVIVAHLWGGLTFDQIAEVTGCSSSTAHRWYTAGLASLRERLGVACPNISPKEY
jgi:RNA polymerase sigma-70 factor (ECF subfamily)